MIKVHIVSGFLGAGKTTLIKKLVKFIKGKKVIIENEFGEVGIDGEIIERENYDVVEMAQGCICCSMKSDFETMIVSVIEDYNPEHIIIEPTGIGMLSEILKIFDKNDIEEKCVLTLPITVVDSLDYLLLIEEFGEFYKDQVRNAGIIVLSKTQLIEEKNIDEIIKSIRNINKSAEILYKDWNIFTELEYDDLTNIRFDCSKNSIEFVDEIKNIAENLQSYSIKNPKEFNKESLGNMLDRLTDEDYGDIIRAKGFVYGEDGSLEFSYVNGRYSINENKNHNSNRMCLIGRNLNKEALSKKLNF
ncbi:CobW/P47K family protein [Gottschalkia acidurici 9a]|uniref:CobW/P47K family protein n=1 Tax=Gottschalkia acidurici (strain ATCC 7906 / DSM 604 / BCRC 14475 / CIP 104303 / KCTC 5404 / NCIMB 10678 / 9a) TaxID=1128398 RepID=K0AZF9_GOTA9|nr:GTP-binding protein [Gottschalkia acidurici]AFS78172.1 CobW/P47K family protein [Gottschalkia acidurici 9a]